MNLQEQIDRDLKAALKARDELKLGVLRMLKSALTYASLDARSKSGDSTLSNDQVQQVLIKESGKRQDSADAFMQAGATERAERELAEKAVINGYLPRPLSGEEVSQLVDRTIAKLGVNDPKMMGQVISQARADAGGRVDGAQLAQIVRERLTE